MKFLKLVMIDLVIGANVCGAVMGLIRLTVLSTFSPMNLMIGLGVICVTFLVGHLVRVKISEFIRPS